MNHRLAGLLLLVVMTTGVSAQRGPDTAGDPARYVVAYVEVAPASRGALVTALKQYRDRSRMEAGFGAIDLFEQAGRPGHVSIVETWKDQASVDGHAMSAAAVAFKAALQSMRISAYDERPYKTLTVAPPKAAPSSRSVHVVTHVDVSNANDTATLLRRLADATRGETGCLRFDVLQHTMRANHFTVVETWASQQAHDAHAAAPHTKQYRDDLQPMTGSPLDERVYTGIE
jgi:quinol monooxygenase YgiN